MGTFFERNTTIAFIIVLLGCSDPFTVDRHDLVEPRILGIQASNGNLQAQVWNGQGAFHENLPIVEWYDENGEKFANGVLVENTFNVQEGMLHYIVDDNVVLRAVFSADEEDNSIEIQRYKIDSLDNYSLSSRLDSSYGSTEPNIDPENMRFISNLTDDFRVRWTTANGVGTILELDHHTIDFIRKDIVFDRSEIVSEERIENAYASLFALAIDSYGRTKWEWVDVWYETGTRLFHSNRYLPIDYPVEGPTEISVLVHSDNSAFGFRFSEPMTEASVDSLSCALDNGPFQWWWVELGVCLVGDIDGQRIVLELVKII